jgi:FkbM family methyltransferase
MKYYIDLGTHKFEGLFEFIEKIKINKDFNVYCYEPNKIIYNKSRENNDVLEKFNNTFNSFYHFNKAVLNYTGKVNFNSHKGAFMNSSKTNYNIEYTTGSNCLDINPKYDSGNGVIFDIDTYECDCIDIEEILSLIVSKDNNSEIYIKCDIEGSEFIVLPKILQSKYLHNIKCLYIEWHERFWSNTNEYISKINEKNNIITKFIENNISVFEHH